MRLHATRKILAPSALDHEPTPCALNSSRSFPFIAPFRPRWSLVVFQRGMPSISFFFMPLRDSVPHNDGGTDTPTPLDPRPGQHPLPRRSILLTLLLSHSCTLFCTADFRNCFRFNCFHTLSQKPPGVGCIPPKKRKMQIISRRARARQESGQVISVPLRRERQGKQRAGLRRPPRREGAIR